MVKRRALSYLIPLLLINGCGSDSITNITIIEAPKSPQAPLVFSVDAQSYFIDEMPAENRLSGGSGAGNIVFTSSDTNVATVDADTGAVTLLDDGEVVITATKAGDDVYDAIAASYNLSISKYDRWYSNDWQFAQDEYTVALANSEAAGNIFTPTNQNPVATNTVTLKANLPAADSYVDPNDFNPNNSATYNASTSATIYDSLGTSHILSIYFIKDGNTSINSWLMVTSLDGELYHFANVDGTTPAFPLRSAGSGDNYAGFNVQLPLPAGAPGTSGIWASRLNFDSAGDLVSMESPDGFTLPGGGTNLAYPTTIPLYGLTSGADTTQRIAFSIDIDPAGTNNDSFTQFASPFAVKALSQDGFGIGNLDPALVSYLSEDPGIAMVDANTGWLTLISNGETTITATVAEDDFYAETRITYKLIVQ